MSNALEFTLNGRPVRVEGCPPGVTLLDFLRARGLTGSKEGCAEGDCGACSVALLDRDAHVRPTWRAFNSCLTPIALMAGRELVSVEGVADGELHPIEQAMVSCHGSQCGYCTPGIICSLLEGYYRQDLATQDQLDEQLCGNLCRCTGYRSIRDAAIQAFARKPTDAANDRFAERLTRAPSSPGAVKYHTAEEIFYRPTSLTGLLHLWSQMPDARLVAGATELGLDITKRYKKFTALLSLEAVAELKEIKATATEWHIGAAATLTEVEEMLAAEYPALADMLRVFGSRQIRNRATLGGNLVTASPIGDAAPVLLALGAQVVLVSARGERVLPLDDFFVAYRQTALQPGELLQSVILPRPNAAPGLTRLCRFYKVSKRREMDISTVAACFAVDLDGAGVVQHSRLAYGGVARTTVRARQAEQTLLGKPWTAETIAVVLPILRDEFQPISDVRGSAEYRRHLATSLLEKFFHEGAEAGARPLTPALSPSAGERENRLPLSSEINPPGLLRQLDAFPPLPRRGGEGRGEGDGRVEPATVAPPPPPHESARLHVTGEALYTDDQTAGRPMLEVWPVCAPYARARILRRDADAARAMPGVVAVLLAEDISGANDVGAVKHDEILLADKEVFFHGHLVALVVGETQAACRAAAEKVVVEYESLPAILTIEEAVARQSFHNEPNFMRRGDADAALRNAPLSLAGEFALAGQDHFYLETHAAWAEPGEDGAMRIVSSTQHPSEVQQVVAQVLGVAANKVVVQCPRMGGGFGGKETQASTPAALAALAAWRTGRPVRVRFNRDQDMMLTGKRHPFRAKFHVGFDEQGTLLALKAALHSNGGWSLDLSQAVTDRALFHLDNAYYIPHVEFQGRVAKTNLVSNTAFRGFGGPQGMLVIEEILDRIARRLDLPPESVRERNLYRGGGETNTTHYGQEIGDNRIQTIWHSLKASSEFAARRTQLAEWNRAHPHRKRGLAMTPVKFGISFTVTHLNQAGALVLIYQDGSVQVNHGGTEMGQGIHTNIQAIAAKELGVSAKNIRVMPTSTDKVPNTSATAASCGTDLNGAAVKNACDTLRVRLAEVAAKLLAPGSGHEPEPEKLVFEDGFVFSRERPEARVAFREVVQRAYFDRVSMSATGYHRTPEIHWDRAAGQGRPFHYFACGAAVSEVEVDGFTGMTRVLRADILHDAGDAINAGVNRGQIEGGFVQGMGWLTSEELKWDDQGRLLTHSPDTYKIPAVGDVPRKFNVSFLTNAAQPGVVHGSKAVGEPPLMLAISVREAIRDAVAAFGPPGGAVELGTPATGEAIFMAIQGRLLAVNGMDPGAPRGAGALRPAS